MRSIRSLKSIKFSDGKNSLLHMYEVKNPIIVAINFLIIQISKFAPFFSLKNFLLGLIGIKIGKDVAISPFVTFDFFFPELISIGNNSIIGFNSTILCHEFLIKECRYGPVTIGSNVMVGANSTILPGISIGNAATISACSLINKDVKANSFVGGVPAKPLRRVSGMK